MFDFNKMWEIFGENITWIFYGLSSTIILSLIGTAVGLILGIFLAYGKNIKVKETDSWWMKTIKYIVKGICQIYSTVIRGTPMMVQAMIFWYGTSSFIGWTSMTGSAGIYNVLNGYLYAGLIVITFNTAAYMGEIVRSGLNGVDVGQVEGARSLGVSSARTSLSVILPQALRNALPTIGNELIVNIKDSSVLNVMGVTELYFRLKNIGTTTYRPMECYIILAIVYLCLTLIASGILKLVEKKLDGEKISLNPFARLKRRGELI